MPKSLDKAMQLEKGKQKGRPLYWGQQRKYGSQISDQVCISQTSGV